jgi:hypothetical protein
MPSACRQAGDAVDQFTERALPAAVTRGGAGWVLLHGSM